MAAFTVSRKTWFRGYGSNGSQLLLRDGRRCCIGFVAQQCGIADDTIRGVAAVGGKDEPRSIAALWPSWFADGQSEELKHAYAVNDADHISDAEREVQLTALFAENGDKLVFID